MPNIYDEMRAVAADLLEEFSQATIKLVRVTKGGGPGYRPGDPTTTETTYRGGVGKGVNKKFIQGTTVVVSELQVITDVVDGIEPLISDKLSINGKIHNIKQIENVPALGTPIIHKFTVEK